jgi:hypothetical protein
MIVLQDQRGPGCLVRGLYFIFIGLWLGALWTVVAWLLTVSIIFMPFGLYMLNRIPQVMTLQAAPRELIVTQQGNITLISDRSRSQYPFLLRAVYFLVIGWWLSAVWLLSAWGLVGVTFGLGIIPAFWMFNRTPAIVSLAR